MQEARSLCGLFSLILVSLLDDWLAEDINAYPMQFLNPWTRPPPLPSKLTHTRRTASGTPISYRLDAWSQYENPEEGAEREGDIHDLPQSRKTTTRDKNLLWPNGIVKYYVHSSVVNEPMKLAVLEDAMDTIMAKTCVKFVRIHPDEEGRLPEDGWVNITGHQKGCFSDLGRKMFGPTVLNLDVTKCFRTAGHSMHEMLHTLGVHHEHMRPDRDEYITIMWENIRDGNAFNFQILNDSVVTNYGLPYDYESIMHYSMTAFSRNRSVPTIIPTTSNVEIGQRSHLSHYDVQKLLITYNCNDIDSEDLNDARKYNSARHKKFDDRLKLPKLNETIPQTIVKSQATILTVHKPVSNGLEDDMYADSRTPMDQTNGIDISRVMHPIWPNYYPASLSYYPIYPHIYFYFYFHNR